MTLSADLQIYKQGTDTIAFNTKVFAAFKEAAIIQKLTYKSSKEAKLPSYKNLLTGHLKKQSCNHSKIYLQII